MLILLLVILILQLLLYGILWILKYQLGFIIGGVNGEMWACVLEGKPVPTFPGCLCRRGPQSTRGSLTPQSPKGSLKTPKRQLTGLRFSTTLGKALALLTKHGLDTERRKEFPVEVAMESLMSTSPLMVKAAPDMDLMSCVDYFLDRCVDGHRSLSHNPTPNPNPKPNPNNPNANPYFP